jgi:phospholipase A1
LGSVPGLSVAISETVAAETAPAPSAELPAAPGIRASTLSRLWELDKESRKRAFAITPYKDCYILPVSHVPSPNEGPYRQADPGTKLSHYEVKFQISFKVKLLEDILGGDADLWAGYTQLSFWQFYDFEDSSPFRETDYEPELLLALRTDYELFGFRGRYLNFGLNHQSNGQSKPLSRSWNRITAGAGFERGDFDVELKGWYRIPEDEKDDDNPEIVREMGYGELNVNYHKNRHRVGISARNNLRVHGNKGAMRLDWSFPLLNRVSGYVQYFNGRGENLVDSGASVKRYGAGFILKEW